MDQNAIRRDNPDHHGPKQFAVFLVFIVMMLIFFAVHLYLMFIFIEYLALIFNKGAAISSAPKTL